MAETDTRSLADLNDGVEFTTASPADLTTDGDNPNRMGDRQYQALTENIDEFGFLVPVIVNRDNVVADGEHRLRAAGDLGLDEIPVVRIDADDPDRRVLRQVMNKLTGDHDIHDDAREFDTILADWDKDQFAALIGRSSKAVDGVLDMLDDSATALDETVDGIATGAGTATSDTHAARDAGRAESAPGSAPAGDMPETVDPDAMDYDHECPQCGYEW